MWYESKGFIVMMILLSCLMIYSSIKRLKMNLEKSVEDLNESKSYAEKYGKHAILIFSVITVALTIMYVSFAGIAQLFPMMIVYVLIIFKLVGLMVEYGSLQGTWSYGKKSFAFDKIQCWINLAAAFGVIARFFTTGMIRIM